jgi:hypothetical protein
MTRTGRIKTIKKGSAGDLTRRTKERPNEIIRQMGTTVTGWVADHETRKLKEIENAVRFRSQSFQRPAV